MPFDTKCNLNHSFETQPDPASWLGTRLTRSWNRAGLKKTKVMTRCDPADPAKFGCNQLNFVFFIKMTPFWIFLKNKDWPGQNPVTQSKPGTRVLNRAGYWTGFKNYDLNHVEKWVQKGTNHLPYSLTPMFYSV
jgi:hypothetical protein